MERVARNGGASRRPVVIVSLGADALGIPGTSIVGGQAVFTRGLAERLATETATTLITLSFSGKDHPHPPENLTVKTIALPNAEYDAFDLWRRYAEIEAAADEAFAELETFDGLVISIYWLSGLFLLRKRTQVDFIWGHSFASFSAQKVGSTPNKGKDTDLYFRHRALTERRIAHAADFVWTTCQHEADLVQHQLGLAETRCKWLPRAVDTEIFYPPPDHKRARRWSLTFVGRLDRRKGIYDIPAILAQLPAKMRLRIAIVGGTQQESAAYAAWFRHQSGAPCVHHDVEFLPALSRDAVADVLRDSRVLLVPSHYENFGNVALEGLACGVPVVASRIGGLPELIKDGVNGYLFSPGEFSRAASAIAMLISRPLRHGSMTGDSRNGVPAQFTWPHLMDQVRRLL